MGPADVSKTLDLVISTLNRILDPCVAAQTLTFPLVFSVWTVVFQLRDMRCGPDVVGGVACALIYNQVNDF